MGLFNRILKVSQAEAHNLVDKLEDPIRMTEQGIRDLKKDLDSSLKALAEVKALAIRTKRELNEHKEKAENYERKAILLLQKAQKGDLDATEAERLAKEALSRKEECVDTASRTQQDVTRLDTDIAKLNKNVTVLKSKISHYENELRTLKARARVSQATKKINKSLSGIDSSGTVSLLEKMKEKVAQDEALAEAYGDMGGIKDIDEEIDDVLSNTNLKNEDALANLKTKMGIK